MKIENLDFEKVKNNFGDIVALNNLLTEVVELTKEEVKKEGKEFSNKTVVVKLGKTTTTSYTPEEEAALEKAKIKLAKFKETLHPIKTEVQNARVLITTTTASDDNARKILNAIVDPGKNAIDYIADILG